LDALAELARSLQETPLGAWARGSSYAYPTANLLHLFGLVMLVGAIGVLDLRLTGLWRAIPAEALSRALTPIGLIGILLLVPSGFVLFAADAAALIQSRLFQAKLLLIAFALVNALAFRWLGRGRLARWDQAAPAYGKAMAVGSVAAWLIIAALGRLIAYT